MVPFAKQLWLFSLKKDEYSSIYRRKGGGNLRIHLYDPESNAWNQFFKLNKILNSQDFEECGMRLNVVVLNDNSKFN